MKVGVKELDSLGYAIVKTACS